jgi:hypothetical protein
VRRLACLLLLGGVALAGTASAARKPTQGEAKAIRRSVAEFIAMPNSPAARNDKIVSILVSTLDPRYAAVRLDSTTVGPSVLVLHRSFGTWFEQNFGSSPWCDAAPKAVLADLHVGCEPPDATAWINNCGQLGSTPRTLVLACADANYSLARLAWRRWGETTATGRGDARANDCSPNCAAGHFHSYPVTVTATQLRTCGRARYYARLTITYPGKHPAGIAKRDVHELVC